MTDISLRGATTDERGALLAPEIIERLVPQQAAAIRHYCRRWALDRDDEDDLVQSTLAAVWEARTQYTGRGSFAAWALKIARTVCARSAKRRASCGSTTVPEDFLVFDRDVGDCDETEAIEDARLSLILSLPPRRRHVLLMRLAAGYSVDETAAVLGCRPGTVKASLSQAIAWLRSNDPARAAN